MAPLKPTGFWSYTSIDDSASGGRLSQLRKLLADELQPHVGRARVHIFQDVAAIPPGTDWEREIDDALEQASFFIPILTPGFMQSEWCAKEVNKFRAIMERRGRNDLIVPVHYLDVDGFDTMRRGECYDAEVYRFLRTLQWTDFRPVRLLEPATLEVRQKLETVATGILAALYRAMPGEPVSLAETGPAPATVDAIELLPAAAAETPPPPPPAAIVETPRPALTKCRTSPSTSSACSRTTIPAARCAVSARHRQPSRTKV